MNKQINKSTLIRLDGDIHRYLKVEAAKKGISIKEFVETQLFKRVEEAQKAKKRYVEYTSM